MHSAAQMHWKFNAFDQIYQNTIYDSTKQTEVDGGAESMIRGIYKHIIRLPKCIHMYTYKYIYIYIHISFAHVCIRIYIYAYIYIYQDTNYVIQVNIH